MSPTPSPYRSTPNATPNLELERLNVGVIGKLFGSGVNSPMNIAGLCALAALLCSGIICGVMVWKNVPEPYEIWKYTTPIITGALGFIFGKGSTKE